MLREKLIMLLLQRLTKPRKHAMDPITNPHGTQNGDPISINGEREQPSTQPNNIELVANGDKDGTIDGLQPGQQVTGAGINMNGQAMTRSAKPVECAKQAVLLNTRLRN
jgi:hypothetical protein